MNKLQIAKNVIKEHYDDANCGIFDCRNWIGDPTTTIYKDGNICIDICYRYSYFEVLGLSEEEFDELVDYYYSLGEEE